MFPNESNPILFVLLVICIGIYHHHKEVHCFSPSCHIINQHTLHVHHHPHRKHIPLAPLPTPVPVQISSSSRYRTSTLIGIMSSTKSSSCDVVVVDRSIPSSTQNTTGISNKDNGSERRPSPTVQQIDETEAQTETITTKISAQSGTVAGSSPAAAAAAGTGVSKRLTKQIIKCGKNYKAALQKLFAMYPFLEFEIEGVGEECGGDKGQKIIIVPRDGKDDDNVQSLSMVSQLMDSSRPLSAVIHILGKVNQPLLGLKLLNQTLAILQQEYDDMGTAAGDERNEMSAKKSSFLNLIYKHVIGMIGQTVPKQQKQHTTLLASPSVTTAATAIANTATPILSGEYMLQLLYNDLPLQTYRQCNNHEEKSLTSPSLSSQYDTFTTKIQPPPIDLYHNTLSAFGKCKRMDLIMKLIQDMESNRLVKIRDVSMFAAIPVEISAPEIFSTTEESTPPLSYEYELPKPDRTSYTTALTAAIRCKAYSESIYILQQMKNNGIYPNVLAYNQVLSCICNAGSMFSSNNNNNNTNNKNPFVATSSTSIDSEDDNERVRLTKKILSEMEGYADDQYTSNYNVQPTESTYKIVMSIYAKENQWDEIRKIKEKMNNIQINQSPTAPARSNNNNKEKDTNTAEKNDGPDEDYYNQNFNVDNNDDDQPPASTSNTISVDSTNILQYMNDLSKFEKMNKRRPIWYKLGKYSAPLVDSSTENNDSGGESDNNNDVSFLFGIQTHRNPSENGLSLVFHEEKTQKKIGYMLIRNTIGPRQYRNERIDRKKNGEDDDFVLYSKFMGMYIDEGQRGKKLATKFLSIWLLICIKSNAIPLTEIINKPLLSLVLTNFGFVPRDEESGVEVEVCPISSVVRDRPTERNSETGWFPDFAMYSNRIRPDDGTFGERELRIQKMMVTKYPPNPPGKKTFVKTSFDHPLLHLVKSRNLISEAYDKEKNDLAKRVTEVLGVEGLDSKVTLYTDNYSLRRAIFGFLYD